MAVMGVPELEQIVDEMAALVATVTRRLEDPETLVVSPLVFQVWGRKPTP